MFGCQNCYFVKMIAHRFVATYIHYIDNAGASNMTTAKTIAKTIAYGLALSFAFSVWLLATVVTFTEIAKNL